MHAATSWNQRKLRKTKAAMMAHALGNPFDLSKTLAFCQKYDLGY